MAAVRGALPNPLRVLVVDDDGDALFLLDHHLRRQGHTAYAAGTLADARRCLETRPIDLLFTDLNLPDGTGLDLLRWLRARAVPCETIVVTGDPTIDSAIEALRLGAADYLTRPVTAAVLGGALARLAQRRALPASPAPAEPHPPARQFQVGPVLLDVDRSALAVNGQPVPATPSELEILHYLCRHAHRVVSAQELVQSLRGYDIDPRHAPELIRPHISNLRRKLLSAALEADIVRTVRGVGYMLRVPG